jgi:hypothetical protein
MVPYPANNTGRVGLNNIKDMVEALKASSRAI